MLNNFTISGSRPLPLNSTATFPPGATAHIYLGVNVEKSYGIRDFDPTNHTLEGSVWYKHDVEGTPALTSLADLQAYYGQAEGHDWETAYQTEAGAPQTLASRTLSRFAPLGKILNRTEFYNADGSLNHSVPMPEGVWSKNLIQGVEVLEAVYPPEVLINPVRQGWAEINHWVYSVYIFDAGFRDEQAYYNSTAINAIKAAVVGSAP